jgi:tetratricopeptide (TPR) repeat protein
MPRPSSGFAYLAAGLLLFGAITGTSTAQHNRHDPRVLREDPRLANGQIAPVLEGLGEHSRKVTAASERAQLFFDQGLRLTYGFNHKEALRAFKEAARLDPRCAMAYWGWALVLGPNLNLPMREEVIPQAWEGIQLALENRPYASQKERDLIDALATRYAEDPKADRVALDNAYASAMEKLHIKYPEDSDVGTLYAAALMNLSPWYYWTPDGRPVGRTPDFLTALESVMERDPKHEGALHYYIHAVEPADPVRGIPAADALRGQAPGAGHLVHMPSHIYMQVGRYAEAFEVNAQASIADEGYITQCQSQGIYPLNYYPHNLHFLVWAATMQGRKEEALAASLKLANRVPEDFRGNDWALYQTFLSMPLYTMVRFGEWETVLEQPRPPSGLTYWAGVDHYARGVAYAYLGKAKKAKKELAALNVIRDSPGADEIVVSFSNAKALLTIAAEVLQGEIAAAVGLYDESVAHLDRAVRLEDGLPYNEPPSWHYPIRHSLGAVLLAAGRPKEAEVVYWQDLARNPENGFSLRGLAEVYDVLDQSPQAEAALERLESAWGAADTKLSTSRY